MTSSSKDITNELYAQDPSAWCERASKLAQKFVDAQHEPAFKQTLSALGDITGHIDHMVKHMDMHNLYITDHIYSAMPIAAQQNILDLALCLSAEPRGEDNHMTNYNQYNQLRMDCDLFAANYRKLPKLSQLFYREALQNYSDIMMPLLHRQAQAFEAEATADLPSIDFDMD